MKLKRLLFVSSLICLFIVCYYIMNKDYNELARYPYATEENRDIILKYLDTTDINYLTAQQIEPKDFLNFIEEEGFDVHNTLWYSKAKQEQDANSGDIVHFINSYRENMAYGDLPYLLSSYSYATLQEYYEKGDPYLKNSSLIVNANARHLVITDKHTLYTFEPLDLITVSDVPFANVEEDKTEILIKSEVNEPLGKLCSAAMEINSNTCGNMIVTTGYTSYQDQIKQYEKALLKYGQDKAIQYASYPGQNEFQLGYSIRLSPAEETSEEEQKTQATWLKENAYKYGFIIRYPEGKENTTGKTSDAFVIRYVGEKIAKEMQDKQLTLNEMVFNEG